MRRESIVHRPARPVAAAARVLESPAMKYLWIDWSTKLPLKGGPGLLVVISVFAIMAAAFPGIAKPLFALMALGALGGIVTYWWRNR